MVEGIDRLGTTGGGVIFHKVQGLWFSPSAPGGFEVIFAFEEAIGFCVGDLVKDTTRGPRRAPKPRCWPFLGNGTPIHQLQAAGWLIG